MDELLDIVTSDVIPEAALLSRNNQQENLLALWLLYHDSGFFDCIFG